MPLQHQRSLAPSCGTPPDRIKPRRRFSLQPLLGVGGSREDKSGPNSEDGGGGTPGSASHFPQSMPRIKFKILMMGAGGVGKSAIIQQFFYSRFPARHRRTVEEIHRGEYEMSGSVLSLEVVDTAGSYEFPAMRALHISAADAFILVYSLDDDESWDEVCRSRSAIREVRGEELPPMVVVANKTDMTEGEEDLQENDAFGNSVDKKKPRKFIDASTLVTNRWQCGFVRCSAQRSADGVLVFQTVLNQANINCDLTSQAEKRCRQRRKSLPHLNDSQDGGDEDISALPTTAHLNLLNHRNLHGGSNNPSESGTGGNTPSSSSPPSTPMGKGSKRNSCMVT